MLEAFALGTAAQSSLLLAGLFACWVTMSERLVGVLAGFGAGALIAAVAFDLVPQAEHLSTWEYSLWMLVGVAVFWGGDRLVDRKFGTAGVGGAMGIVVGSVVDGVPESMIFGTQIAGGLAVSGGFLAAVFVSNIPQAVAPSATLVKGGWSERRVGLLWLAVVLACGVAAALGWLAADLSGSATGNRIAALAAGGILAMLTDSLMPFAFEKGKSLAGLATVVGFCLSLLGS